MDRQTKVYKKLDQLGIQYKINRHKPVFTIEEFDTLDFNNLGVIVKNLFLRDAKGRRHFLVVMHKDKKANLKDLRLQLESTALSFASEDRLQKYLDLTKGSVTPLGIINDEKCLVDVIFDKDLVGDTVLGVHPNDNSATVWISYNNLKSVIEDNGNKIKYVDMNSFL